MKLQLTGQSDFLDKLANDFIDPVRPTGQGSGEIDRNSPEGVKRERLNALAGLREAMTNFNGELEAVEFSMTLPTPIDDGLSPESLLKIILSIKGKLRALENIVSDYNGFLKGF